MGKITEQELHQSVIDKVNNKADIDYVDGAVSNVHTHANKALLDTYNQTETDLADAVAKKHSNVNDHMHSNKSLLDTYTQTEANIADAISKKHSNANDHTHSNKTLLDTYSQTEVNLSDAVSKKHTANTDTGTSSSTFQIDSGNSGVKIKNNAGVMEVRNSADSGYADLVVNQLTIKGNATQIQSEVVTIADSIITLNSNVTGTPSENGGLSIERGTSTNASLIWDESNDKWKAGIEGSETGISLEGHTHTKSNITDFTHTHTSSDITNFSEDVQDTIGSILTDTSTIDFTYNDASNQITADVKDSSVSDTKLGNRTIDQAIALSSANTGTLTQLLSWIVKEIKAIKGSVTNWYDGASASISTIWGKFNGTNGHKHTGGTDDAPKISYTDLINIPTTFTPASHTQTASTITDFDTAVTNNATVTANTNARHSHSNKTLLDSYTQTEVDLADAVSKKHSNSLDHTHTNKTLLDSYTQTEIDLSDAVSKKHSNTLDHTQNTDHVLTNNAVNTIKNVGSSGNIVDFQYGSTPITKASIDSTGKYTGTIDYTNVNGKPTLATVATSGSYTDLSNTPALATVATSGSYTDLSNKPSSSISAIDTAVTNSHTHSNKATLDSYDQTNDNIKDAISKKHSQNTDNTLTSVGANTINTSGTGNVVDFKVNSTTKASIDNTGKFTGKVDYSNVNNTPTLATVATSGSYTDLNNKPTIPTALSSLTDDATHRLVTDTQISNWGTAYTNNHTHSNKATLDTYTQTETNLADAVSKKHSQNTDTTLTGSGINVVNTTGTGNIVDFKVSSTAKASIDNTGKYTGTVDWANVNNKPTSTAVNIDNAVTNSHTHTNKATLDSYTQSETNLADAVSKKHTQNTDNTLINAGANIVKNSTSVGNIVDFVSGTTPTTKASVDTNGKFTGTIDWGNINSKPTFSTVATSGSYTDLSNKPTSMTPTAHKATHATGGIDVLTPADIGASPSTHNHDSSYAAIGHTSVIGTTTIGHVKNGGNVTIDATGNMNVTMPTSLPANGGTADTLTGLTTTVAELNYVDGVTSSIQTQLDGKEPSITKKTAFNVDFETTATNIKMNGTQSLGALSTVARADHAHPSDSSKASSTHTHGNITNAGAIGSTSGLAVVTGTSGVLTTGTIAVASGGTGATTASGALTNLGLTATATEINVLDGITATVTELNYVDGVTSNIQTQLNGKAASTHTHAGTDITSVVASATNADTVDSKHVDDTKTDTSAVWTASKIISYVSSSVSGVGTGDMSKSTYDTDLDGKVDVAETADKLTTARNIAISGAVTGNANFDGGGNITITTTSAQLAVGTTAPTSPATNLLWVDTN